MNWKIIIFSFTLLLSSIAYAEDDTINAPQKYIMSLVTIFEEGQPEHIIVVGGNTGFRTVESFKKFVAALPEGIILEWAPGCGRVGGEPILSSEKEMKEFENFCKEHKIIFKLIASG